MAGAGSSRGHADPCRGALQKLRSPSRQHRCNQELPGGCRAPSSRLTLAAAPSPSCVVHGPRLQPGSGQGALKAPGVWSQLLFALNHTARSHVVSLWCLTLSHFPGCMKADWVTFAAPSPASVASFSFPAQSPHGLSPFQDDAVSQKGLISPPQRFPSALRWFLGDCLPQACCPSPLKHRITAPASTSPSFCIVTNFSCPCVTLSAGKIVSEVILEHPADFVK